MSIASPNVHFNCFNYDKENPLIQIIEKDKGKVFEFELKESSIVIVTKGKLIVSYGTVVRNELQANEMATFPFNSKVVFYFEEDSQFILFRIKTSLSFCDHFPLENLYEENINKQKNAYCFLKVEQVIAYYIRSLEYYLKSQLKCSFFHELKIRELLYVIRIYYPYEKLQLFFNPVINKDMIFAEQVYITAEKAKSIKELAEMLGYSISGFEKRFKTVFGVSVNKWLQQERAKRIYHELNCSTKSIAEIGSDFGFTSASHFNDYCKRIFKFTPGKIRKMNTKL